jgi:hypothetical protein
LKQNPRNSIKSETDYLDNQNGWRFLFLSFGIACLFGLCFRLYFSPSRIKAGIEAALEKQTATAGFTFEQAHLSLSKGARPQLAIVLQGVHFAPAPLCHPEPSLSISELTVPFRLSALLSGRIAVGVLTAEDLVIDLDGMKARCENREQSFTASHENLEKSAAKLASKPVANDGTGKPSQPHLTWWTDEQLKTVQQSIEGFDFERVDLQFEEKTKHVYLESMGARSRPGESIIRVSTEVRIPPELVFGEKVPTLVIDANVLSDIAHVSVHAGFSEGTLIGNADLVLSSDQGLHIDTDVKIRDVPLSTTVPLLIKSGIIQNDFQPQFQWLSCEASIQGPFQGLFEKSSLSLKNCSIEGSGSRITLSQARRLPNGTWDPFHVEIAHVDMNRVLNTFHVQGPGGISSDFGRLSGAIDVFNGSKASFKGSLAGISLMFSSRELHSEQRIKSCGLNIELNGDDITGEVSDVALTGGDAELHAEGKYSKKSGVGEASFVLERLKFDPAVNRLMLGGELSDLNGGGKILFQGSHVVAASVNLNAVGLTSDELKIDRLGIATDYHESGNVVIHGRSDTLKINSAANWFKGLRPMFLGHEIEAAEGTNILFKDFSLIGEILKDGSFHWSKVTGAFENGKIQISSLGTFNKEFELTGSITTDFPVIKRLQWLLSGTLDRPVLSRNEKTFQSQRRTSFDDHALGLPMKKLESPADTPLDEESRSALREIGKKVIEKARVLLPSADSPKPASEP